MANFDNNDLLFGEMLSTAMDDYGVGCTKLEEILKEKDIKIQFQAISSYARGVMVPSYEKAKILLETLEFPMEEEELIDLLERSRQELKAQKRYVLEENAEIRKNLTVRIRPRNISPDLTAGEGIRILQNRIESLFGNENKFSDYINMLIVKDLKEFVLNEEDIIDE